MKESWRDVKNYEGLYQVSNTGKVKSLARTYKNRKCEEIIKSPSLASKGYYRLPLCKEGKIKYYYIHRLVAEAFIPNPNNYKMVNHKDENKLNNNANNLEWCTHTYNMNYGNINIKRYLSIVSRYLTKHGRNDIAIKINEIKKEL